MEAALLEEVQEMSSWTQKCSSHLSHIEKRAMRSRFLCHELLRQFGICLENFSPPPFGSWSWMLRQMKDLSVDTLRTLVEVYLRAGSTEAIAAFMERGMVVVRLCLEEALSRQLQGCSSEDPVQMRAYLSMMLSLHELEENNHPEVAMNLRLFSTLTEGALRTMGLQVRGATISLRSLPSFAQAMAFEDMRVEVLSLLPVEVNDDEVAMTTEEVRAIHLGLDIQYEEGEVPSGTELPSKFGDV